MAAETTLSDAEQRASMFIEWCALQGFGCSGWPPGAFEQLAGHINAARREADARVAAAVMAEREAISDVLATQCFSDCSPFARGPSQAGEYWADGFRSMQRKALKSVYARPAPDHADTLATLLAEAREQGRREMREMAVGHLHARATKMDDGSLSGIARIFREEAADIRALPVTIPTPEAPQ